MRNHKRRLLFTLLTFLSVGWLPFAFNACGPGFSVQEFASENLSAAEPNLDPPELPIPATPTPTPPPIAVDRTDPRLIETAISPAALDAAANANNNDQYALLDTRVPSKGYLVLYLFGAGTTRPMAHLSGLRVLAGHGVHVICPDYSQNYGIATDCMAGDRSCFGKKRLEAITGQDASPIIDVTRANSIEERFERMVVNLAETQPTLGWGYFLTPDKKINWERVIVAGHSHGSASSSYIGKLHKVARVVALGGPDDIVDGGPSDWMLLKGQTPPERYFALVNSNENRYLRYRMSYSFIGFGDLKPADDVSDGVAPAPGTSQVLYFSQDYGSESLNHGSSGPSYSGSRTLLAPIFSYLFSP